MQNPTCFSNHMGPWAIEPGFLSRALSAIRDGTWKPQAFQEGTEPRRPDRPSFEVVGKGIALISIAGVMQKGWSKFGGTSTLEVRRQVREAVASAEIRGILLRVESPGGGIAGTMELAEDVRAAAKEKPVHVFVDDMGASAALWATAHAGRITGNRLAQVGSIGVFAVLEDTSKAAELAGVKVHVIRSGPLKGADAPGTPVTDELLGQAQTIVDRVAAEFFATLKRGRRMSDAALAKVTTGEIWLGEEAVALKLLDGIGTLHEAVAGVDVEAKARGKTDRDRAEFEFLDLG